MCLCVCVRAVERGWVVGGCIRSICIRSCVCGGQAIIKGEREGQRVGLALWLIAEIISHVVEKSLRKNFNLDIKNIICPS